jgi:outer membrane protein OmpA-like peptidoglycan-associated protein
VTRSYPSASRPKTTSKNVGANDGETLDAFRTCPLLCVVEREWRNACEPPPPEVTREIELSLGSYLQKCPHMLIRFPFNESQPLPQDTPELEALAACLNSSPYRDVRVRLIGRTDREGTDEYNQKLGLERAEYVKDALVREGVDPSRIETESAGAQRAGEGAPGYDRRVDVVQMVAINPI